MWGASALVLQSLSAMELPASQHEMFCGEGTDPATIMVQVGEGCTAAFGSSTETILRSRHTHTLEQTDDTLDHARLLSSAALADDLADCLSG